MSAALIPIAKEPSLLDIPGCLFTRMALEIPDGLSFDHWQRIGAVLQAIEGSIQFWIGDWLRHGERMFGESYAQAVEATGYREKTLRNAMFVASNVEASRRRESLGFSVHAEVASLRPREQEKWLAQAEKYALTVKELRWAIKRERRRRALSRTPLGTTQDNAMQLHLERAAGIVRKDLIGTCPDPDFSRRVYGDLLDEIDWELRELSKAENSAKDPRTCILNLFAERDYNAHTTLDLVHLTGLRAPVVWTVMTGLQSEGMVTLERRGGKTEVARGDVERIWRWKGQPLGSDFTMPRPASN